MNRLENAHTTLGLTSRAAEIAWERAASPQAKKQLCKIVQKYRQLLKDLEDKKSLADVSLIMLNHLLLITKNRSNTFLRNVLVGLRREALEDQENKKRKI